MNFVNLLFYNEQLIKNQFITPFVLQFFMNYVLDIGSIGSYIYSLLLLIIDV